MGGRAAGAGWPTGVLAGVIPPVDGDAAGAAGSAGATAGRSAGCSGTAASFGGNGAGRDAVDNTGGIGNFGGATGAGAADGVNDAGRCANGAGDVPWVDRGELAAVDGRTNGIGIPPGAWVGRAGAAGIPPGDVGRTADPARGGTVGLTSALRAGVACGKSPSTCVRAGVGNGSAGAGDRAAGLVAGVTDGGVSGATLAAASGGVAALPTGTDGDGATGVITRGGVAWAGGGGDAPAIAAAFGVPAENSSCARCPASMAMTAPHTEHLARTLDAGRREGSTRKTDRHSGQTTFMRGLLHGRQSWGPLSASRQRAGYRCGGQPNTPIHPESWRSSSFPSQVH